MIGAEEALERLLKAMRALAEELEATRGELKRLHEDFEKMTARMPKKNRTDDVIDDVALGVAKLLRGKK